MENNESNGSNLQTSVTINTPSKVIHCSDGVIEDIHEENVVEVASAPQNQVSEVDPKTLAWGPWFSHYACKSGSKVLNAVDYAGESLASFFGITTPKYQIEIDEYERIQEIQRKIEEDSAGWVPKNGGGDIPLVMNEPVKDLSKPADV
ncbi:protein FAM177A1-like [Hyposmocoma kahamanoa]|uniref:protein FAM177A1-like n=1 Tax=Hyposmocoma kahamanoa TaxID=1477025 RepID=UPI000E6D827C|nr:protein FAM177A1-like [Hyposmocoma kahamanoa]